MTTRSNTNTTPDSDSGSAPVPDSAATPSPRFPSPAHWIGGRPVPGGPDVIDVVNPANGRVIAAVPAGTAADVDSAVAAARTAFPAWAATGVTDRVATVRRLADVLESRVEEIALTITAELGSPLTESRIAQAGQPVALARATADVAQDFPWSETIGNSLVLRESLGVVGAITPWNFPLNQMMSKVAPALLAGNTLVVKPSEVTPLTARILAEAAAEAGLPGGVLNIVHGAGPVVGAAITAHPDVDMVTFTGSTAAGRLVAASAADSVKRVTLELGGKSASVVLPDADLEKAVALSLASAWFNNGQVCAAWTRLIVPADRQRQVAELLVAAAEGFRVGDPMSEPTRLGPLVSETQRERVDAYIRRGLADGARLVFGGPGRPDGCETGAYVRPTIFTDVDPDAVIAQEEIFGPVLSVIPYTDEEHAVAIANNSVYGLHGAVFGEPDHALSVARRLRTGQVDVNGGQYNMVAPFGGYKQSGNGGREFGRYGLDDQLETKSVQL
ncbi:aldehyde dehydrogenase family protein [Streptomyces sp. NPDC088387]|uniref:aldehyde dehydrogenase family protein n=1 Tax=Streptomyces sp. NPDC088387 TaxID=3365859 RepID=UPI0037F2FFCE